MPEYLSRKIKDERGKWIRVYGKTEAELAEKVAARLAEVEQLKALAGNPLVYQYAKTWYNTATRELSAKTKYDYANALNNHICPYIGDRHVMAVAPDDIDAIMEACSGLSRSAQSKIVSTLRQLFKAARKAGLTSRDPCEDLRPGGAPAQEKPALLPEQVAALLDAVQGLPIEGFCRVGLYAGLRREEILGLCWDCVHLEGRTPYIQVRRALRWANGRADINETLKSRAARRDIPIPPQLVAWLRAERDRAAGAYVFCDTQGNPWSETTFRNRWHAIKCRQAGPAMRTVRGEDGSVSRQRVQVRLGDMVPRSTIKITLDFEVTPHILRHTYITNLILSGANIKKVQYLAGHARVETTLNIYTHLMQSRPENNMDTVLGAFAPEELQEPKQKGRG